MKKTDLAKNKGLALANKLKNSQAKNGFGPNQNNKDKKELSLKNPLLASLIKKS